MGEGEVNAERGVRNAESGKGNAECGTRNAELEDEDVGLAEAIDASPSKAGAEEASMAAIIPHSALRVPNLNHGPHRVALHDLKRGIDRGGEEIFIESEEEHTRQPKIWYKRDRRGDVSRFVRNGWGSTAVRLGRSAFL
jgi:hypothetical protein